MENQQQGRSLEAAIASHDNGFNLVRLVCALLVVAYHTWVMNRAAPHADPVTRLLAPNGDLGALAVGVFFVISGMFIARSWMGDPHLGRFALRRVARIVPGLFACLLISTVAAVVFFSAPGWRGLFDPAPWRFIFGNTVLHGLVYDIPAAELRIASVLGGQDLNGPLWTLYWEGRMYVMVALVGLAAATPLRSWMRGAALFLLLAANLFPQVAGGYVWEVRMWSLFLVGIVLQTLAPDLRIGWRHVACALGLLLLNWTRSAALTPSPLTWFGIALLAVTLALCVGSRQLPWAAHVQRHDYSYGIYIWHWPAIIMLREVLPPVGPVALTLATLALVLPLAMLSWHLVEAPALRAARRWLGRGTPQPVALAA
ncbi:acyltransferase family protein [Massilia sp. X63]|uniref:acyltransferase family protein n=1 Tax=Massilia sp. X63 TaxID=3237285 RepID=UPI0034DCC6B8